MNKPLNKYLAIYKKLRQNIIIKFILSIASAVYFLIYKTRLNLYKLNILKSQSLDATVISVGNISSGGTGKTPLVIEIAKYLTTKGYKVAILSRGYKRLRNKNERGGTVLVSDSEDILTDLETSGDEPFLIAKKVPKALVLVGSNKVESGKAAIRLGAEILILDDGFQHIRLNRDENILLLDSYKPFDNYSLIPKGLLREYPDSITRSSAIIISNADKGDLLEENKTIIKKYITNQPVLPMKYKINQFTALNIKKTMKAADAKGLNAIAFCGIGNPNSFLDNLKQNDVNVVDFLTFSDHYNYRVDDIKDIIEYAVSKNIENIITTEKDSIKIEGFCETAPATFWTSNLEISWDISDPYPIIFTNKSKWLTKKTNLKAY